MSDHDEDDVSDDCPLYNLAMRDPPGCIEWQRSHAPPLGIYPRKLWEEDNPDPSNDELRVRWVELLRAVDRYERAGLSSNPCVDEWRQEVVTIRERLAARRYAH